jgi:hypothetical protein
MWVLGQLQYAHDGRIVQIGPIPKYVHQWLAEWRAGDHPAYD